MRLVDIAPMLEHLDLEHYDKDWYVSQYNADWIYSWLDSQPTIEAEPVKHGRWELRHVGHGHYWECSNCHTNPCIYVTKNTKFCPNCGAKMKEEGT